MRDIAPMARKMGGNRDKAGGGIGRVGKEDYTQWGNDEKGDKKNPVEAGNEREDEAG